MAKKYFNKLVFYNKFSGETFEQRPTDALPESIIKFDSKLEFTTFEILKSYISEKQIVFQSRTLLKPKTRYSTAVYYDIDFCILNNVGLPDFYVEAKGVITKEASLKLKILEVVALEIREKLMIVSQKTEHYFGRKYPQSTTLAELKLFLGDKYGQQNR